MMPWKLYSNDKMMPIVNSLVTAGWCEERVDYVIDNFGILLTMHFGNDCRWKQQVDT